MIWGMITWYVAMVDAPLFCGDLYHERHSWIAVPVEQIVSGNVRCGDMFAVWVNGDLSYLPVCDTGGFGSYCIQDGRECEKILADLPKHAFPWSGLSVRGYVVNSQPYRDKLEEVR